jgi:hypothetical protein
MTLFSEDGAVQEELVLEYPDAVRFEKGQWHVHANPYDEISLTLFKAEGDITAIVQNVRETFTKVL